MARWTRRRFVWWFVQRYGRDIVEDELRPLRKENNELRRQLAVATAEVRLIEAYVRYEEVVRPDG